MGKGVKLSIYTLTTLFITILLLVICKKRITKERTRDLVLKASAIITVIIHYSSLWVDFFTNGSASVEAPMLLPIYPCNICMWLLFICAFKKKKETIIFKVICEFTALAGVLCGFIGTIINENFLNNPNFLDYDILKGLISHTTMVFGCLYLIVMEYMQIRVISNMFSCFCGLVLFVIDGIIINTLFAIFKLPQVNSMYLLQKPFPNIPFLNFFTIGVIGLIIIFCFCFIYELITLKRDDRCYYKLKHRVN